MQLDQFDENSIQTQAADAGFATPALYIQSLLQRDADRLAIKKGIAAYQAGNHRPFEEFDKEFRETNGLAPRS